MSEQEVTWADPTAAALFGVAGDTTAVWALLAGRIGRQDLHIFIVWLMGAALILTIAGLINLRRGETVGGSLNLAFGVLLRCPVNYLYLPPLGWNALGPPGHY